MSSSRPYKVKIREAIQEVEILDDSVSSKIDIIPTLPSNQMEDITRTILHEHGFEDDTDDSDNGTMSREKNGVNVTINPSTCEVVARAEETTSIDLSEEDEVDEGGCPCRVRNKEKISESMRKRLARRASDIRDSVQELVTGRLQGSLADLGCEMEQIANQITGRALKRRAQEIGTIKRISHNDQSGEVTIVVEVNS